MQRKIFTDYNKKSSKNTIRLAKFLASAGVGSRRTCETYITDGLVRVNGVIVLQVATSVDPDADVVEYNGARVKPDVFVYYVLNKPVGYVCSAKDSHNDNLVTDLVPKDIRVYPVGRLDKDSSGLLIMTNDGDLALQLTHPRYESKKVYIVTLKKPITQKFLTYLRRGVRLIEGVAKVDSVEPISSDSLRITLHQGWKRQIRRMIEPCDNSVETLTRVSEGKVRLGKLQPGEYRVVAKDDIL